MDYFDNKIDKWLLKRKFFSYLSAKKIIISIKYERINFDKTTSILVELCKMLNITQRRPTLLLNNYTTVHTIFINLVNRNYIPL